MHRAGTSYQLPTGAAVYFDTGVIEVATPLIELERGCMARAGRSLWESIRFMRGELDAWEQRTAAGLDSSASARTTTCRSIRGFAQAASAVAGSTRSRKLLTYVLPAPVMLLATNRAIDRASACGRAAIGSRSPQTSRPIRR